MKTNENKWLNRYSKLLTDYVDEVNGNYLKEVKYQKVLKELLDRIHHSDKISEIYSSEEYNNAICLCVKGE